jgi:hypothetical protein
MSLVENEARLRQAVRQIQRCLRDAESRVADNVGESQSATTSSSPIATA